MSMFLNKYKSLVVNNDKKGVFEFEIGFYIYN